MEGNDDYYDYDDMFDDFDFDWDWETDSLTEIKDKWKNQTENMKTGPR